MLDALVVAITSIEDKAHSGVTAAWKKYIYIITDGQSELNLSDTGAIRDKIKSSEFIVRVV